MKRKKVVFAISAAIIAAVLIALGLYRVIGVYRNYRTDMLTYESRHLENIASSSARGLDWILDGYTSWSGALVGRREFSRAETEYLETGDPEVMRLLMARPDTQRMIMPYDIVVYDPNGAYLASTAGTPPLDGGADEQLGGNVSVRADGSGVFWFIFKQTSESGFRYELIVPVQTVFAGQAEAVRVGRGGVLFMLDAEGLFISCSGQGISETESVETVTQRDEAIDEDILRELAAEGGTERGGYRIYRYPWPAANGKGHGDEQTLVVTSGLTRGGSGLLIGAAMSFQEFNSFLSETLREVTGIIFLELGGALILFALAAWVLVMNRRNALELKAVRERADLMEEINRQQQSLAHTERLQQLGIMTSGIVHEFNNMLTPIMSQSMLLLEQLAERETSPEFDSALDIYEASENARDVLKRMSALGKKDADMQFRTLEVGSLLKRTLDLASMAKDPHIRQELLLPKKELFIFGNEQLLIQAFLNLCINACQAMDGEGTLSVRLSEEVRSGQRYVRAEVCDTGTGIPEDMLVHIFDSYVTTKGERGTGLGLSICRKIVERHKGTIIAGNRAEGGAVFTVRIPAVELPED